MKLLSFGTSAITPPPMTKPSAGPSQSITPPVNTHQLLTWQKDQLSLQRMGGGVGDAIRDIVTQITQHLPTFPSPQRWIKAEDSPPTAQGPSHHPSENLFLQAFTKPFKS